MPELRILTLEPKIPHASRSDMPRHRILTLEPKILHASRPGIAGHRIKPSESVIPVEIVRV